MELSDRCYTNIFVAPCGAGEQPNADETSCEDCPINYYKNDSRSWKDPCTKCVDGRETVDKKSNSSAMCIGKKASIIHVREEIFPKRNQKLHVVFK